MTILVVGVWVRPFIWTSLRILGHQAKQTTVALTDWAIGNFMCFEPEQYDRLRTQLTVLKQSLKDDGFEHFTTNRSAADEKSYDDFQPLNEMLQVIKS